MLRTEEFESNWNEVIDKYGLEGNNWLKGLYNERDMDKHTRLREFVERYCEAMEVRVEAERQNDAQSATIRPELMTGYTAKAVFRKCYTNMKFKEVQRECSRTAHTNFGLPTQISETEVEYLVDDKVWCRNRHTRKEFLTKYKRV